MSELSKYDRQRREANTYNLFLSSLTPRADPCLTDRGWFVSGMFTNLTDSETNTDANPDFVLYDGDICLMVEVKSGNNIEDRHIEQMTSCDNFTIVGAENELENLDVEEKTPYDGTIRTVDSCIIYQDMDEEYVNMCRNEWENCKVALESLEQRTAVLTQDYGGKLRLLAGEFESNRLQRLFDGGIILPQNPKEEIMLTEGMEKEILAVAICDIWGETAVDYSDPVEVNVNEVRNWFSPHFNVPADKINKVLYYLEKIGACEHIDGYRYQFKYGHLPEILTIEKTVRENPVDEYLTDDDLDKLPDESQATLDEIFTE